MVEPPEPRNAIAARSPAFRLIVLTARAEPRRSPPAAAPALRRAWISPRVFLRGSIASHKKYERIRSPPLHETTPAQPTQPREGRRWERRGFARGQPRRDE